MIPLGAGSIADGGARVPAAVPELEIACAWCL